jgi:hypothetical protein
MGVTGAVAGLVELEVSPGCETQTIPAEQAAGEATEAAGCLIEAALLQYRQLTQWIAYLLGGPSPERRSGSEAFW